MSGFPLRFAERAEQWPLSALAADASASLRCETTGHAGPTGPTGATGPTGPTGAGAELSQIKSAVLDWVYPVGTIYTSFKADSPALLFGGTWERLKDTFLLAAGDTYAAGSAGGEAEHTLTEDEMPKHCHSSYVEYSAGSLSLEQWDMYFSSGVWGQIWESGGCSGFSIMKTNKTGGNGAHNNMPPYLAVYMWRRTA